jgi:hypothetical protein
MDHFRKHERSFSKQELRSSGSCRSSEAPPTG